MKAKTVKAKKNGNGEETIEKRVNFPLAVTVKGKRSTLKFETELLVKRLQKTLPLTMRLGRGRRETITINAR